MTRSAASVKRPRATRGTPARVVIPTDLKDRVVAEAKRRGLGLAPALRVLLTERVDEIEIEDTERLSSAEERQRAQAWATWERMKAGDVREASKAEIDLEFDAARARIASR